MRNARKRRRDRKHGKHPAKPRPWATIKPRLEPVVRAKRSPQRPKTLSLMEL